LKSGKGNTKVKDGKDGGVGKDGKDGKGGDVGKDGKDEKDGKGDSQTLQRKKNFQHGKSSTNFPRRKMLEFLIICYNREEASILSWVG
jgi:hypothetical protein